MCGICGFINVQFPPETAQALIGAMCDVIIHRGPDEEGYFVNDDIALGMRRLKIIDLSTGSQPIFNEDKSVVVVFNGEIYNFPELRDALLAKGHTFTTHSDTEVIVHLYEEYGEDVFSHLNGMFGIALWDLARKKLLLGRDRLGEKPLYYTKIHNGLLFGSELKSLCCFPGLNRALDHDALLSFFTFNYIPAPHSVYHNIHKLLPGEMLVFDRGEVRRKRFWQPRFAIRNDIGVEEWRQELFQRLTKAVSMRMISDVPLGAFLSGGIDSSIMVALMSRCSSTPIKTFSIGLEDDTLSELPFARAIAERYQTDHHELIARPDALALLNQITFHFDEPFADPSAIPTFLVSQLTKNFVTVAISGDGGDELFGGYERYRRILRRQAIENIPAGLRKGIARQIGDRLPIGCTGKAFLQSLRYDNYDFFAIGDMEGVVNSSLFTNDFLDKIKGRSSLDLARNYYLADEPLLNQCMFFDLNSYLPDDILVKVDRMSMAVSLETRAPFLDHTLVEFALTIPAEFKTSREGTKMILKDAFRKELPASIFSRHKSGFSIPLADWFRKELKPFVLATLHPEKIGRSGILSVTAVQRIISQHMAGQRNHYRLLWMLIIFQSWHDTWFAGTHPTIAAARLKRGCTV